MQKHMTQLKTATYSVLIIFHILIFLLQQVQALENLKIITPVISELSFREN